MMTPLMTAEEIRDFLKDVFNNHRDEFADGANALSGDDAVDEETDAAARRPVNVYVGYPPVVKSATAKREMFPYIAIHPAAVKDTENESVVSLDVIVETYDEDQVNGDKTLYHLLELIRYSILTRFPHGHWTMKPGTMQTEIPPEQPYPYWVGIVSFDVNIPQPQPNYSDQLF